MGTVALDTCVLIYAMERHPELGPQARAVLEVLDDPAGRLRGVVSTLALLEVLAQPLRLGRRDLAAAYRERLASPAGMLTLVPVSTTIAERAAELRASVPGLKTPDAIHAATALVHRADALITNDAVFRSVPGLPVVMLPDWRAP